MMYFPGVALHLAKWWLHGTCRGLTFLSGVTLQIFVPFRYLIAVDPIYRLFKALLFQFWVIYRDLDVFWSCFDEHLPICSELLMESPRSPCNFFSNLWLGLYITFPKCLFLLWCDLLKIFDIILSLISALIELHSYIVYEAWDMHV